MNAKERKEKINHIIKGITEEKNLFKQKFILINSIINKADELDILFNKYKLKVEDWNISEIKRDIILSFVELTDLNIIFDNIQEFKSELDEYIEDLPESKQEAMQDKYAELDDIDEITFYIFDTYDEVIEFLDKTIDTLTSML